jgi:hypothetical protein
MQRGLDALGDLRRVAHHPRIRLIDPLTPGVYLTMNARAVITINSTTGMEGIIHHKPVITLGRAFFSGRGLTIDVSEADLPHLPEIIQAALDQPQVSFSDEDVLRFLLNLQHLSTTGNVDYFLDENNDIKPPSAIIKTISRAPLAHQLAESIRLELG